MPNLHRNTNTFLSYDKQRTQNKGRKKEQLIVQFCSSEGNYPFSPLIYASAMNTDCYNPNSRIDCNQP